MSEKGPTDKGKPARPRAMGQFSAVEEGAGTTIVGAQPPRRHRNKVNVPAGVEKVLYLAATDRAFHDKLMNDRDAAVAASGVPLKASELAMLRAAPAAQLKATIAALDVTPENLGRRRFMKAVAVSAVTLAAANAAGGCGDDGKITTDARGPSADAGIADVQTDINGPSADAGVAADMPSGFDSGGIRPSDAGEDANKDIQTDTGGPSADAGTGPDMP